VISSVIQSDEVAAATEESKDPYSASNPGAEQERELSFVFI
jgi:hypothetical protein